MTGLHFHKFRVIAHAFIAAFRAALIKAAVLRQVRGIRHHSPDGLQSSGGFIQARQSLEQALCINPYYTDALYNLRDTYTELNNKIGAGECDKRLKELEK